MGKRSAWAGLVLVLLCMAVIALVVPGCSDPRVPAPKGVAVPAGTPVTILEYEGLVSQAKAEKEAQQKAAEVKAAAELGAVKRKAEAAAAAAVAEAQEKAEEITAQTQATATAAQLNIKRLSRKANAESDGTIADAIDAAERIKAEVAREAAQRKADLAVLDTSLAQARADIAARQTFIDQAFAVGSQVAGASASLVPGGGLIAPLLGLAGLAFGVGKQRQVMVAKANEATVRDAAGRVIDSIDILKQKSPEVRQAFKDNAAMLLDWQGADGAKLVQSVQNA